MTPILLAALLLLPATSSAAGLALRPWNETDWSDREARVLLAEELEEAYDELLAATGDGTPADGAKSHPMSGCRGMVALELRSLTTTLHQIRGSPRLETARWAKVARQLADSHVIRSWESCPESGERDLPVIPGLTVLGADSPATFAALRMSHRLLADHILSEIVIPGIASLEAADFDRRFLERRASLPRFDGELEVIDRNPLFVGACGSGPVTVVALNGGPGFDHRYLVPELGLLSDAARVLFYDQRGCGESTTEGTYGWRQHVEDLDALLAEHVASGPVVLAGSSWGSILALLYAHRHPGRVAGLVISGLPDWPGQGLVGEPGPVDSGEERASPLPTREPKNAPPEDDDGVIDLVRKGPGGFLEETFGPELETRFPSFSREVSAQVRASLPSAPPLAELATIDAPTLIFQGTANRSHSDGSDDLAATLPHARIVRVENAGHDPWFEDPVTFHAQVVELLGAIARGEASREP